MVHDNVRRHQEETVLPEEGFLCGRCHSKHTFHKGCLSEQGDEKQQPSTEQNKNREQQDLPEATPEPHQHAETPSEWKEVEQNDAAPGQPTGLESGDEETSGEGNELECNYPSASDETQQQPNAVVQGEEVAEANEIAADNQKKDILIVIPPTFIENQRLDTGESLLTQDAQKWNRNTEGGTKKKNEDSNLVTKRDNRHGFPIDLSRWILHTG